jgi:hypothetical protein
MLASLIACRRISVAAEPQDQALAGQLSAQRYRYLASRAPLTFSMSHTCLDAVARQLFYDRLLEDFGSIRVPLLRLI